MTRAWTLTVSSRRAATLWEGEAERLLALLQAVSTSVAAEYGEPLAWRSDGMSEALWSKVDAIAAHLSQERLRDDAGAVLPRSGASSIVQGYRTSSATSVANATFTAGASGIFPPFHCGVDFYEGATGGRFRPLPDNPVDWLVDLLLTGITAINGTSGRIVSTDLLDELIDARDGGSFEVGSVTYLPPGRDPGPLPPSLSVHHRPTGAVVVADLHADPAAVVPDLLALDDALRT